MNRPQLWLTWSFPAFLSMTSLDQCSFAWVTFLAGFPLVLGPPTPLGAGNGLELGAFLPCYPFKSSLPPHSWLWPCSLEPGMGAHEVPHSSRRGQGYSEASLGHLLLPGRHPLSGCQLLRPSTHPRSCPDFPPGHSQE